MVGRNLHFIKNSDQSPPSDYSSIVRYMTDEEVFEEGRGPRVLRSKGSKVQGSQGPKDQDISNLHSNTSLTLKKVHLVFNISVHFNLLLKAPLIILTNINKSQTHSKTVHILIQMNYYFLLLMRSLLLQIWEQESCQRALKI